MLITIRSHIKSVLTTSHSKITLQAETVVPVVLFILRLMVQKSVLIFTTPHSRVIVQVIWAAAYMSKALLMQTQQLML